MLAVRHSFLIRGHIFTRPLSTSNVNLRATTLCAPTHSFFGVPNPVTTHSLIPHGRKTRDQSRPYNIYDTYTPPINMSDSGSDFGASDESMFEAPVVCAHSSICPNLRSLDADCPYRRQRRLPRPRKPPHQRRPPPQSPQRRSVPPASATMRQTQQPRSRRRHQQSPGH